MSDAECVRHARGRFAARGNGAGRDFQHKLPAETVRGPPWALTGQALGNLVEWSDAEGGVRKVEAVGAIVPGRAMLGASGSALVP